MCWSKVCFNHCYECSREFNHKAYIVPCRASETGKPCALHHEDGYVIEIGENCDECKASRSAEEECQRSIYRSRPLCLDIKGKERMSALFASYRHDLRIRKQVRTERVRRAEIRRTLNSSRADDDDEEEEELKEDISPMLITARHQYNTSYMRDEPVIRPASLWRLDDADISM